MHCASLGPNIAKTFYEKHRDDGRGQSLDNDLLNVLRQLVSSAGEPVYIVIDALDECPQGRDRDLLLQTLGTITGWQLPELHILVTSRDENDIRSSLLPIATSMVTFTRGQTDADVAVFLDNELEKTRWSKWPAEVRQEIRESLLKKADGM